MGQNNSSTSLGDFSGRGSFGAAFHEAHGRGGPGHTFSYQGKQFSTNCADGGDYRRVPDNRSAINHAFRADVHQNNAMLKDSVGVGLDALSFRGTSWSAEVDRQRVKYHENEIKKIDARNNQ